MEIGAPDRKLHRQLHAELVAAGCFRRAPFRSAAYGAAILAGYGAAYLTLMAEPSTGVRVLALVVLAFLCVQASFLAHEAGHGALTRDRRIATLVGQVFNTLLTALCYSYFQHIHRAHHPYTNERSRDPDMQSDVFGLYAESAHAKHGVGRFIARHQPVLLWVLVWLQGLTFKIDSLRHLMRNPRTTRGDQLMLAAHFVLWFVPPVMVLGVAEACFNYSVMTLLIGGYTGSLFLVNHIGTRVMEPGERLGFLEHEVAVTRNLGTSRLADIVFGGLNNHVEHHCYPSMPTARLRAARGITREFCKRHGIAYREMSWIEAAREVTGHLRAMSAQVPA